MNTTPHTLTSEPIPGEVGTRELAKLVGISERRILQLVDEGTIPKLGRNRFDTRKAIGAYIFHVQDLAARKRGLYEHPDWLNLDPRPLSEEALAELEAAGAALIAEIESNGK